MIRQRDEAQGNMEPRRQAQMNQTLFQDGEGATGKAPDTGLPLPFDGINTYLLEVSKYPVLTREEEFEVSRRVFDEDDRKAAERLVVSNLRLVVKIALEYYNTYSNVLDLIQEGNMGLLRAVKKYNPHKGTKFATYAAFWIRAFILKYIMDSWSLVKVGTTQDQRKLFYRLNKEKRRLEALGVHPTPKLLAGTLDVKEKEVVNMEKRLALADVSLEAPISDESDDTVMDTMKSDINVEEIVEEREKSEVIAKKVLEFKRTISDKESFILDHRVMAEEPSTLQEIGVTLNISRERVRQIENGVVRKFRKRFENELASLDR
jgi:RNA polymerase sigma-32 factor